MSARQWSPEFRAWLDHYTSCPDIPEWRRVSWIPPAWEQVEKAPCAVCAELNEVAQRAARRDLALDLLERAHQVGDVAAFETRELAIVPALLDAAG